MRPISENVQRKTSAALWALLLVVTLALCWLASPARAASLDTGKPGSGHGVVASDTGGIDCGGVCAGAYSPGASVQLTATRIPIRRLSAGRWRVRRAEQRLRLDGGRDEPERGGLFPGRYDCCRRQSHLSAEGR
ncbi:MAG: hypothetical protein U5O69_10305 [Candidatus Competibacteraceae bacterium]|nr:hypothetical protein [Candidatus Competibacteraceae bacterium]